MVASAPLAVAALGPLLPLLIVLARTLPPSAPQVSPPFAVVLAAIMGLVLAVSLTGLALRRLRHFPPSMWLPIGVFVGSQFVALGLAVDPLLGVFSIACTLGGVIVLIASVEALANPRLRRIFLACYFSTAIAATLFAVSLSIMRLPPAMFAYEHGRASGTFLQPNEFASYLLFVIPIGLAQIAAPRWLRMLGLCAAAVGAVGLLFSVSRAAIVSLMLGLTVFVRRFGARPLAAYALTALVAFAAMATVFRDVAHDPSENASRIAVWQSSLRLAERFALTGVGPFGFHRAYPALKRPEVSVNEVHAHDVPLHILIEDGVLGLAGLVFFVVAATAQAARSGATIPRNDRERVLLFAALGAGFAASALQNLVDVVTTFLLISAWPMLGLLLSLGQQEESA